MALLVFGAIAWMDYLTSYEVSLAVFYYLPIGFAAWRVGRNWSYFFSTATAFAITYLEHLGGRHYTHSWMAWEHGSMRFLNFGFVAFAMNYFKAVLESERKKISAFDRKFPICAHCNRVSSEDGFWMDFPTFLRQNTRALPEFKVCPSCTALPSNPSIRASRSP